MIIKLRVRVIGFQIKRVSERKGREIATDEISRVRVRKRRYSSG